MYLGKWDIILLQWVNEYKYEYEYNLDGNMTPYVSSYWDNNINQWIVREKYEYLYDPSGREIQLNYLSRNNSSNMLDSISKLETAYNTDGGWTKILHFWNKTDKQWMNSSKDETNIANGDYLSITYSWDNINTQWVCRRKVEYTMDSNATSQFSIGYANDTITNLWIPEYKYEYTFDNSYSEDELVLPSNSNGKMQKDQFDYVWDKVVNQWLVSSKTTYYYSEVDITNTRNFASNELKTFPNPSKEYVAFELKDASTTATIELFDIQGKKVISQILPLSKQISVNGLKSGIYFYIVNQKGKLYNGKIVVN